MTKKPELSTVGEEHGMTTIAARLYENHRELCANAEITPWDFCCALSNVQAWVIAESKDMAREDAIKRIEALEDICKASFEAEKNKVN